MKLHNIHGFGSIDEFVRYKIGRFEEKEKNFETLFELMFDERENVMVETTDGYRIKKESYGAVREKILDLVPSVARALEGTAQGSVVGLYMQNSPQYLVVFWSILAAGYRPLLMNTRLSVPQLETVLQEGGVAAVLSDGAAFSVPTVAVSSLVPVSGERVARAFGDEVLFMSSGTSEHVKLCAYTGENFYYQILSSAGIIARCPNIKRHFEGELKQLVLLPLCHVFGFIAVYLWFGFFARTFVFPRDLDPVTIQRTVKKHKVTHIFAVPMVWEAVARAATSKIRGRGEKTYRRFLRASSWVNALPPALGGFLARRLLGEVREGLFGDSIQCMISGGSAIAPSTLRFFNGIGYPLANGYGMTEIGITSLETAIRPALLNLGSVGAPIGETEYALDENGILLVRGKTRATRIVTGGVETKLTPEEWFSTGDLMEQRDGRWFACGRSDDLIVGEDGENLNPLLAEAALAIEGVDRLAVIPMETGAAVVASVPGCFSAERFLSLSARLSEQLEKVGLARVIRRVYFTAEGLLLPGEIKLSRKGLSARIRDGSLRIFCPEELTHRGEELFEGVEQTLVTLFARALGRAPDEIGRDSHFFRQLQGTSLDFYTLLTLIREEMGVEIPPAEGAQLATVREFYEYLKK